MPSIARRATDGATGLPSLSSCQYHEEGYVPGGEPFDHLWISILSNHFSVNRVIQGQNSSGYRGIWHDIIGYSEALVTPRCFSPSAEDTGKNIPDLHHRRFIAGLQILLSVIMERARTPHADARVDTIQVDAVNAIHDHIQTVGGRGVSLDSLARLAGYSKYHFLRIYRAQTGMTPQQHIDECRRVCAKRLLRRGWTKTAVAEDLGFSHLASFSRWAARHMNT